MNETRNKFSLTSKLLQIDADRVPAVNKGKLFNGLQRVAIGTELVNSRAETERLRNECLSSLMNVLEMQKDLEKMSSSAVSSPFLYHNPMIREDLQPWNQAGSDPSVDLDLSRAGIADLTMTTMGNSVNATGQDGGSLNDQHSLLISSSVDDVQMDQATFLRIFHSLPSQEHVDLLSLLELGHEQDAFLTAN